MEGIIAGVDESDVAQAALRWALDHAAQTNQPITAVMAWGYIDQHHLERGAPFDPQYSSAIAAKVLDDLVSRAVGDAADVARIAVCDLPARALLDAAVDASLLVVGARGIGGFRGLLLGSVSRQVLHAAGCPVAIIRDAASRTGKPVVVGVDGSAASQRALAWAVDHAVAHRLRLIAVHAWHLPFTATGFYLPYPDPDELAVGAERFLHEQLAQIDTSGLVAPVEYRAVDAGAAAALIEAAALASLVVVGSRGHGQLTNTILGSVSDQVSHHATSPVVVVP
jgi:nucleotide-binding universal stress UspA family protein